MAKQNSKKPSNAAGFKALVLMQLKAAFSFSFKGNKKNALIKMTFYLAGVAAMTAILYLLDYLLGYLHVFGMSQTIPIPIWNIFFFGFLLFSFFSCLIRVNDALYFSNDNAVLLSLPLSAKEVFLSKLVVFGIQEFLKNCLFLLPLLVSVGLVYSASFGFYLWVILMVVVLSLLPLGISSFLAAPVYHIRVFFRRHPIVQSTILLVVLVFATTMIFYWTTLIPENLDFVAKWASVYFPAILSFVNTVSLWLFPLFALSAMAVGYEPFNGALSYSFNPFSLFPLLTFLVVVLVLVGSFIGAAFLTAKSYPILAMRSHEFKKDAKSLDSQKKNRKKPRLLSYLIKEIVVDFRSSQSIAGNYFLFIVTPLATLLLNAVFDAMHKSYNGEVLTLLFNGLIIALVSLTTNVAVASIYSRDGEPGLFDHVTPKNLLASLLAKLTLRFVIMTASLIFAVVVFSQHCSIQYVPMVPLFFSVYCLYIGHLLWSAELDYMNPVLQSKEQVSSRLTINRNELKSTVFGLILSALFAGLLFLFVFENNVRGFTHLLVACVLFALARIFLFVHKVRAYGLLPYEGRTGK